MRWVGATGRSGLLVGWYQTCARQMEEAGVGATGSLYNDERREASGKITLKCKPKKADQ